MYSIKKIKHTIFALMSALVIMSSSLVFAADDDEATVLLRIVDLKIIDNRGVTPKITDNTALSYALKGTVLNNPPTYPGQSAVYVIGGADDDSKFTVLLAGQPILEITVMAGAPQTINFPKDDSKFYRVKINNQNALVQVWGSVMTWMPDNSTLKYRLINIRNIYIEQDLRTDL